MVRRTLGTKKLRAHGTPIRETRITSGIVRRQGLRVIDVKSRTAHARSCRRPVHTFFIASIFDYKQ